ncbi:hypothetical protein FN846DRAFT_990769 [Sphaerosporella brunnea]|uniref:Uncharacterized protein n=1 Tax=Sphaerosporella brunnea TaxID=1250544 RepID=A0A5J5EPV8_9PEZI|nr:hypothetical protein FN846DRAFT_990769 [Sphaerosporella brunnea]
MEQPSTPSNVPTPIPTVPVSQSHVTLDVNDVPPNEPQGNQIVAAPTPEREAQPSSDIHPQRPASLASQARDLAFLYELQKSSRHDYHLLETRFLSSLSKRKRNKALINQARYDRIHAVLKDPKDITIGSSQFRYWARRMFRLKVLADGNSQVLHADKLVAVREDLHDILTVAHIQCQHGGRDKTAAQVKTKYSWVPRALVARFVMDCRSCMIRRPRSRLVVRPPRPHPPADMGSAVVDHSPAATAHSPAVAGPASVEYCQAVAGPASVESYLEVAGPADGDYSPAIAGPAVVGYSPAAVGFEVFGHGATMFEYGPPAVGYCLAEQADIERPAPVIYYPLVQAPHAWLQMSGL